MYGSERIESEGIYNYLFPPPSAGLDSTGGETHTFIPDRSVPFVTLPGIGSKFLIDFTQGQGSTKRRPEGSPALQTQSVFIMEKQSNFLLVMWIIHPS